MRPGEVGYRNPMMRAAECAGRDMLNCLAAVNRVEGAMEERKAGEAVEREARERSCFGMSEADMAADLAAQSRLCGWTMLAMCILSDAQHRLAEGDGETARQYMNKAKWVLGTKVHGPEREREREAEQTVARVAVRVTKNNGPGEAFLYHVEQTSRTGRTSILDVDGAADVHSALARGCGAVDAMLTEGTDILW